MFVLQMSGFPGSGKSTLARLLSNKTGAVVIDRDIIKTSMLQKGMEESEAANYSYVLTFDLAKYYLSLDRSVIIDTPCYYQNILEQGMALTNDLIRYKYIECFVDDFEVIQERVAKRESTLSQIKVATYENYNKTKDKIKRPKDYLKLETTESMLINVEEALNYLNKGGTL